MEHFYGITTTTLVVLSSFSLAVFQLFFDSVIKPAKSRHESLKEYSDLDGNFDYECSESIKYDLSGRYDELKEDYKKISRNSEIEIILLLFVVFMSSVSIFYALLHGIYEYEWGSEKIILSINLVAITFYIYAFTSFVIKWNLRKKKVSLYVRNVEQFFIKINTEKRISKSCSHSTS